MPAPRRWTGHGQQDSGTTRAGWNETEAGHGHGHGRGRRPAAFAGCPLGARASCPRGLGAGYGRARAGGRSVPAPRTDPVLARGAPSRRRLRALAAPGRRGARARAHPAPGPDAAPGAEAGSGGSRSRPGPSRWRTSRSASSSSSPSPAMRVWDMDIDPGIEDRVTMNAVEEPLPGLIERISRHANLQVEIRGRRPSSPAATSPCCAPIRSTTSPSPARP